MKKAFELENLEQVRAIADPLRVQIIWAIFDEAKTGKMIATELGLSAPKVHYHLRELEKNGLIMIEREEEKNGIMQKFYRPIAKNYSVSSSLLTPELETQLESVQLESFLLPAKELMKHLEKADAALFKGGDIYPKAVDFKKIVLTIEQRNELMNKINELEEWLANIEANEQEDGVEYVIQYEIFPYQNRGKKD
ncbi:ArsR/SmtB family transcription factor [Bacillus chungangensis]|uniref:DNA-binding transcriptional ArsR family regulator n=1 Tax=Bacillus chungangensis TaxID=587633 RepID=A0ABT9WNJ1_9BACI|nr:winged helix-turn-helix domain-containing protein [Bacillus chungangensis]MDQ0174853.1 DNA-binding transcriptional ArsR family regulator [Bacillus chungangensis]